MIKQVAVDVEAAEGDKFLIRYCNDFELPRGDDSIQPEVDLIFVGQRGAGRRPLDELALIEQGKKAGGMLRATRAKLHASRWREPVLRCTPPWAAALGRRVVHSISRSPCFHRPDLCWKPDAVPSY